MNIVLITLLIYLVLMFGIAWFFSRKESLDAYFLNRKNTGLLVMTLSIVSTFIGAGATVAIVSETYATGISYGIALPIAMVFAVILLGITAKRIKKLSENYDAYTLVDFFYKRFDQKNRILIFMLELFVIVLWIAMQTIGMASLATVLTNLDFNVALFLVGGITILYTAVGGLKIDFITDFIQFWIILIVFIIMASLGYQEIGSFPDLITKLPASHLDPFAFGGVVWFLGVVFLGGFFALGNSANWQRIIASKNQEVARNSFFIAIPIILFLSLLILFFGLISSVFLSDINQDLALFSLMEYILPPYLVGLGFASILAVIMSSVDSLLVGGSTIIYRELFKKNSFENKNEVFYARLLTGLLGLFAFTLAFIIPKIVTLSIFTTYLAIGIAIPALFALYSKKISSNASFYALLIPTISLFIAFPIIGTNSFLIPLSLVFIILIFYDKIFKKKDFILMR